jgi:serine/threonine protein kinase
MQRQLFALAQVLAATGMTMTSADSRQSDLTPSPHARYELRSRHTPSVGVGNIKPYHAYRKLGSGSFGTVSKVVDLSTGELLAMKELREGKNDDAWKKAFKDEVEIIAKITHVLLPQSFRFPV